MKMTAAPITPIVDSQTACPNRPALFVAPQPTSQNGTRTIRRVLIANRGEIACRVIASCHKLNISAIAVYVEEDKLSRHISDADEAINLGHINQEGGNPYLNIQLLVETARGARIDAIHPGYGYLSENSKFADAVREAGIIFIGPSAKAMSTLGDKRTAKDYLRQNEPKVPLIPGFSGSSQDVKELEAAARDIGFPVMLKASAGGGGKGMRIVREASKLKEELTRAQSEASRSFGSADCILEKYIEAGKHIEIQIVGDSHGNVISLWERECSVQRRHQKVIEETPSPWVTPGKRKEMSDVAKRIGQLLGYENAGTVEFVVDVTTGNFYFLEVNTRLQVEHPITEEVTGIDIVALQLFVAAGGDLSTISVLQQIPQNGVAIECRLCAEDPQNDFFPEHGTVRLWQTNAISSQQLKDVRFETAVETGSRISIFFDSMIAKIVVWAPTRPMAIQKMVRTLSQTVCAGVKTNQLFLQSCLLHASFQDPSYTTSLIPNNLPALLQSPYAVHASKLRDAVALIPALFLQNESRYRSAGRFGRPFQKIRSGFRNQRFDPMGVQTDIVVSSNCKPEQSPVLVGWKALPYESRNQISATTTTLELSAPALDASPAMQVTARYNEISKMLRSSDLPQRKSHNLTIKSCETVIVNPNTDNPWINATLAVSIDGNIVRANIATESYNSSSCSMTQTGEGNRVFCHVPLLGTFQEYTVYNLLSFCEKMRDSATQNSEATSKSIVAPMPCKILQVLKKNGEEVGLGETVMIVESMKMEMAMSMTEAGKFEAFVGNGDNVDEGTLLCRVV